MFGELLYRIALVGSAAFFLGAVCCAVSLTENNRPPDLAVPESESETNGIAQEPGIPEKLVVEVTGNRFRWSFRFAGADGKFRTADDVKIRDTLHLPADSDVELRITSADYLYVFSIPELALRRIAVPELTYSLAFRTNAQGDYQIKADPFCGVRLLHPEDMGMLVVEPRLRFNERMRE